MVVASVSVPTEGGELLAERDEFMMAGLSIRLNCGDGVLERQGRAVEGVPADASLSGKGWRSSTHGRLQPAGRPAAGSAPAPGGSEWGRGSRPVVLTVEALDELGERGGTEALHRLLVASADTVHLAVADHPERPPALMEEARGRRAGRYVRHGLARRRQHAYAMWMQAAVASGTVAEMVAVRTRRATSRYLQ